MNTNKYALAGALLASVCLAPQAPVQAGETPINNSGKASGPAPGSTARTTPDAYYFCIAGIGGSSKTLYVTPVMRESWPYDITGAFIQRTVNPAWQQAIKALPLPFNGHCVESTEADAARIRQQQIDQEVKFHDKIVDVDWHYGQSGPATPKS